MPSTASVVGILENGSDGMNTTALPEVPLGIYTPFSRYPIPIIILSMDLNEELAVEFIDDDELVEITPVCIRLRKRYLTENERKRHSRAA